MENPNYNQCWDMGKSCGRKTQTKPPCQDTKKFIARRNPKVELLVGYRKPHEEPNKWRNQDTGKSKLAPLMDSRKSCQGKRKLAPLHEHGGKRTRQNSSYSYCQGKTHWKKRTAEITPKLQSALRCDKNQNLRRCQAPGKTRSTVPQISGPKAQILFLVERKFLQRIL